MKLVFVVYKDLIYIALMDIKYLSKQWDSNLAQQINLAIVIDIYIVIYIHIKQEFLGKLRC